MDGLLIWDYNTFQAINTGMANRMFDAIMPLIRNQYIWVPVYVFFAAFFLKNFGPKGAYIILFGLVTFMLSDQISAHIIKPLVDRIRPCSDVLLAEKLRLLVPCGSGKSFPSTHATNHFAFSLFVIGVLPRLRWVIPVMLFWAALVSFAQIYVGLHFPLDIITGALLGSAIGLFTVSLYRIFVAANANYISERKKTENETEG